MKKIKLTVSVLLCAAMLLSFAACGGNDQDPPKEKTADTFTFVYKDVEIRIDDDMSAIREALGEPKSYFEAESCAFDGIDKTFSYPGFTIVTRPDGDKDYINCITFTDDSVKTFDGLYIGNTKEQVVGKLGEGAEGVSDAKLIYSNGAEDKEISLEFILKDGTVSSISLLAGIR